MGFQFQEQAAVTVDADACTDCARCAAICPTETLVVENGRIKVARRNFMGCIGCGHCMLVCESGAIRVSGRRLDASDLVDLPGERASFAALDALMLARRSVRRFARLEVDGDTIRKILSAASTAPMGIPPTDVGVIVFDNRAKVREFTGDVIACFRRTSRFFSPLVLVAMRPFVGSSGYRSLKDFVKPLLDLIAARWDAGEDALFYEAPAVLLFHHGPFADPADASIAATYAMLAAQSLGLGTCMIGTMAVLDHHAVVKRKIGVPEGHKISLALILGHPAVAWERGVRRRWSSVRWA
jgi:nitroreductase/NAD-dependent dihydropyrimidine dehydrogenase PreA subunit